MEYFIIVADGARYFQYQIHDEFVFTPRPYDALRFNSEEAADLRCQEITKLFPDRFLSVAKWDTKNKVFLISEKYIRLAGEWLKNRRKL